MSSGVPSDSDLALLATRAGEWLFTHGMSVALKKALERHDFDCTQMALNAALQGMQNGRGKMVINPALTTSFEHEALPVAKKKNMGVLAMKVFGQEDLLPDPNDKADLPQDRLLNLF